MKSKVNMMA